MKSVLDNFDGIELWHINLDGIYVFLCAIFALQDLIEELRYNHFNFSIGYEIVNQLWYRNLTKIVLILMILILR